MNETGSHVYNLRVIVPSRGGPKSSSVAPAGILLKYTSILESSARVATTNLEVAGVGGAAVNCRTATAVKKVTPASKEISATPPDPACAITEGRPPLGQSVWPGICVRVLGPPTKGRMGKGIVSGENGPRLENIAEITPLVAWTFVITGKSTFPGHLVSTSSFTNHSPPSVEDSIW